MNIQALQKNWNELGKVDPWWAVLTEPGKKGGRWQAEEFYTTGTKDVELLMQKVRSLVGDFKGGKALDFGCGVGRMTQPLCQHFQEVHGVDIAPSMITLAKQYDRYDSCHYQVNESVDLSLFADGYFDFACSHITLQHMSPKYMRRYLQELVRVLCPGGILVFQLPSNLKITSAKSLLYSCLPTALLDSYRRIKYGTQPRIDMYGVSRKQVGKWLHGSGAELLKVEEDASAGPDWVSWRYYAIKRK